MSRDQLLKALDGPTSERPTRVRTRKPGADYWRRVSRIAGALPVAARLKIALRILKGGESYMAKKKPKPKPGC